MARKPPSPKIAHHVARVTLVAHLVYYAATAGGFHSVHAIAAGAVVLLLLAAWLLGLDAHG